MPFRAAYYWFQELENAQLAKRFHLVEGRSIDHVRHRTIVPKHWFPVSPLLETESSIPLSYFTENPGLGERAASIVVFACTGEAPRQAAEAILSGLGLALNTWEEEDNAYVGSAGSDSREAAVRLIPYLGAHYLLVSTAPTDRFQEMYAALHHAINAFSIYPDWAHEEGQQEPW